MAQTSTRSTQINDFRWTIYPGEENEHESMIRNRMDDVQHRLSELEPDDRDWFTTQSESDTKYFIKIFRHDSFLQRSRYTLFGSQAWHEWNHLLQLHDTDVPVPEPVALGQRFSSGLLNACVLVCRNIDGTTLRDVLDNQYGTDAWPSIRSHLWSALADLTVQLIEEGFYHQDYHDENLLVLPRLNTDNSWKHLRIYVTDLHRARSSNSLTSRNVSRMLAFLIYSMRPEVPLWECQRLFQTIEQRVPSSLSMPSWSRLLDDLQQRKKQHQKRRTLSCLESRDDVLHTDVDPIWSIYHKRAVAEEQVRNWIDETTVGTSTEHPTMMTSSETRSRHSDECTVLVHKTKKHSFIERCKRWLGHSPARNAWKQLHGLQIRHFNTPDALALVEPTNALSNRPSYLITEQFEGRPLYEQLQIISDREPNEPSPVIKKLLYESTTFLCKLHAEGIFHENLSAKRIWVKNNEEQSRWTFVPTELDRITFHDHSLPRELRMHNLVQLNASLPEQIRYSNRYRMWKRYLNWPGVPFNNPKNVLRKIIERTRERESS